MVNATVKTIPITSTAWSVSTVTPNQNLADNLSIEEFTTSRQTILFQNLKQKHFTGQLILRDSQQRESIIHFCGGRFIYATGGIHPVRRWKRNLTLYCPRIVADPLAIEQALSSVSKDNSPDNISWEYQLLSFWAKQQKTIREQIIRLIRASISEVLFDLAQAGRITYELKSEKVSSTQLVLLDADQIVVESWKLGQAWQGTKLAARSPNTAPIIKKPEQLQLRTSPFAYQLLTESLNGEQSLRDLAVSFKQDVVQITRSLMPYIQSGLIELVEIPDLPAPIVVREQQPAEELSPSEVAKKPLIACIDSNPVICQRMERIIKAAGYDCISFTDGLEAIAVLLENKPELIFIEPVMPNTNGFNICTQLRQLPFFRQTPMILFTENLNLMERLKAKMVGCADFIGKPLAENDIRTMVRKHLAGKEVS
jgi:chemotaxis family two-component system response regulator PixG